MPGPKPPPIELTPTEQQELEKLVKRHNVGQQIALRGRIVLAEQIDEPLGESIWLQPRAKTTVKLPENWRSPWIWCAYGEAAGETYSQ